MPHRLFTAACRCRRWTFCPSLPSRVHCWGFTASTLSRAHRHRLYGCLLENVTCEQASKMSAMENASNNATEMIGKLRLTYNRQRQAVITTELTEIVAGAESV